MTADRDLSWAEAGQFLSREERGTRMRTVSPFIARLLDGAHDQRILDARVVQLPVEPVVADAETVTRGETGILATVIELNPVEEGEA